MLQTNQFIQAMSQHFDHSVASCSDDELFAAGYLRGHIDLAVGTLQLTEQPFSIAMLAAQVEQSLQQAIVAGELSSADQQLVLSIWQQLQSLQG